MGKPDSLKTPLASGSPASREPDFPKPNLQWFYEACSTPCEQLMTNWLAEFSKLPGRPNANEATAFQKNQQKNRYKDIPCLDKTRVQLKGSNDYIHANWVQWPDRRSRVIIAQAPMKSTVQDWWQLIMQEHVSTIICLTSVKERGVEKCFLYWPVHLGKNGVEQYGEYYVRCRGRMRDYNAFCSLIELYHRPSKRKLSVRHLFYLGWPDYNIPRCTHNFVTFLRFCSKVINNPLYRERTPTVLIHCSAGVGRSGTFSTLYALQYLLERHFTPNVPSAVSSLRTQRCLCVQGKEQYLFIYRVLMELVWQHEKVPENIKPTVLRSLSDIQRNVTRSRCDLSNSKSMSRALGSSFVEQVNPLSKRSRPKSKSPAASSPAAQQMCKQPEKEKKQKSGFRKSTKRTLAHLFQAVLPTQKVPEHKLLGWGKLTDRKDPKNASKKKKNLGTPAKWSDKKSNKPA